MVSGQEARTKLEGISGTISRMRESDMSKQNRIVRVIAWSLEPAGYGNLVSQRRSSTTSFYHFDRLGSTRKLTSSAIAITDSYDFRTYGETFASSGSTVNVFRWVGTLGYYYDLDRLAYYLRARPYSPKIARFLSQDPLAFLGNQYSTLRYPITRNFGLMRYSYASINPTQFVDPSGLITCNCNCQGGGHNVGREPLYNRVQIEFAIDIPENPFLNGDYAKACREACDTEVRKKELGTPVVCTADFGCPPGQKLVRKYVAWYGGDLDACMSAEWRIVRDTVGFGATAGGGVILVCGTGPVSAICSVFATAAGSTIVPCSICMQKVCK